MSDYAALAAIYDRIGFSTFAENITPHLVTYAQQNEWMGRHVLDLGMGTGASLAWFCEHHYLATGVDRDPAMLAVVRRKIEQRSYSADLIEADLRENAGSGGYDMALALDVLNETASLRDLEPIFKAVHKALTPAKLFIFDLHTTEGLFAGASDGDRVLLDESDLLVLEQSERDFERQVVTRDYAIFTLEGAFWERESARRVLRAYPVQPVITLLRRSGFDLKAVLDTQLNAVEPGTSGLDRVIIVTQKVS